MGSRYRRHRFPPQIISYAVWVYHRFTLSFRDVEELLAERGVTVSYESIRRWCHKFGPDYARSLRRKQARAGDIWFADELFITIRGQPHYLWRAVDQDGDVIDILVTRRRDRRAAKRFFLRTLKHQGNPPWQLVTDKLRSYPAAHREVFPSVIHRTGQCENNRAEAPHQPTRQQERQMRGVQICRSDPAVPGCPRSSPKPVPSGSPPSESYPLSAAPRPGICRLEMGHLCLLIGRSIERFLGRRR